MLFEVPSPMTTVWRRVLTKRSEKGMFSWPRNVEPEMAQLRLMPQTLAVLADEVDLSGAKLRPWFRLALQF
jgi:transposase